MSSDDALIGRRLIELRAGRSQVEVAGAMRDAGWSWGQATVWNLEQGKRALKLAEARDLAAFLGCSIEDLLPELSHEQLTRRRRWLEAEIERAHQIARDAEERAAELTARLAETPGERRPP
jgi:hypothetical protein